MAPFLSAKNVFRARVQIPLRNSTRKRHDRLILLIPSQNTLIERTAVYYNTNYYLYIIYTCNYIIKITDYDAIAMSEDIHICMWHCTCAITNKTNKLLVITLYFNFVECSIRVLQCISRGYSYHCHSTLYALFIIQCRQPANIDW